MESQASRQQFTEAKRLFDAGQYNEALQRLAKLNQQHPDVFNIQYPMLQCLHRLGRTQDLQTLFSRMRERFPGEAHQARLRGVEAWLASQAQAAPPKPNPIDDYFDIPQQYKAKTPKAAPLSMGFTIPWKALLIGAVVIVCIVGGVFAVQAILPSLGGASEFSADMVMSVMGMRMNGKVYLKSATLSRAEFMDQIFIMENDQVHLLVPEANAYITMNVGDVSGQLPILDLSNFEDFVEQHAMNNVGRERIQGYACDIYEGRVRTMPDMPAMNMKVWYAPRLRYPVKTENTLPGPFGASTITVALENINTGVQPDSLFAIPAGYTQIDGLDFDELPSEEELDRIMREMNLQ